jgi:hypothetical protein
VVLLEHVAQGNDPLDAGSFSETSEAFIELAAIPA